MVAKPSRTPITPDQLMLQAELAREVHAETDFTGELLRKVREAEIAGSTKIALDHLAALEEERYGGPPCTA